MLNFDEGHRLLKDKKYLDSYNYFFANAKQYIEDKPSYNRCVYGQARALLELKYIDAAQALLLGIIKSTPTWEAPYITLARSYEQQGNVMLAHDTYIAAMSNLSIPSEKFREHYDWFLKTHTVLFNNQPQYTPSYTALNQNTPDSTIPTVQTNGNPKPRLYQR